VGLGLIARRVHSPRQARKSDTGQINEVLCKVLAHNICVLIQAMHALNIHPIFRDVQISAGRGEWPEPPARSHTLTHSDESAMNFGSEIQLEPKMTPRGDF
jgi:hypothetical protein